MSKWNTSKMEEEIKKASEKNLDPPVPVTTSQKINHEETIRRYDRG